MQVEVERISKPIMREMYVSAHKDALALQAMTNFILSTTIYLAAIYNLLWGFGIVIVARARS